MKLVIALNFLVLSIIMVGLFFISKANYKNLNQASKFWSIAIVCDALGLALMGYLFIVFKDFTDTSYLGTMSNTLLFSAIVFQTVSIQAIKQDISKSRQRIMLGIIGVFGLMWELLRGHYDTNAKVLFFGVFAALFLLGQVHALWRVQRTSSQLRIMFYSVVGEWVLTVMRMMAVYAVDTSIVTAEQIPVLGLFSVWIQYALKIVVYAALVAYWSENLAKAKAQADFESQQFKALSERQERLIADLGRLNKATTAGVLAASIAHELSQPLQSTLLNATLSFDEAQKAQPDWVFLKNTLQEQVEDANRMTQIISTLRGVFSESDTAEAQVDLFEVIQSLGLLITPQAEKRGIAVVYEKHDRCVARLRIAEIQQVVLNIVGNAFDALHEANTAHPQIKIVCKPQGRWVMCTIEDNGPGLPGAGHDDVFKFLKSTKTSGMGLGLWLSKYIVARNGGEITAGRSALGGAMFTLLLPAA